MAEDRPWIRPDAYFWRSLAAWGAAHAPEVLVRYSPPAWALLFAASLPKVRARVLANLRRIHGTRPVWREQADVVRTFSHFASCFTEALAASGDRPHPIDEVVVDKPSIVRALAKGRGVIIVTAHTGAWETTGPLVSRQLGLDLVVAMASERSARARQLQDNARLKTGVRVVHIGGADRLGALELYTHLRAGGAVGLRIDRLPPAMRGIEVEMFGERVEIPGGPFELARASGAPIVPVFSRRLGYFRYEVRVGEPMEVARRAGPRDLAVLAQAAAKAVEAFVRENPTHWFHFAD